MTVKSIVQPSHVPHYQPQQESRKKVQKACGPCKTGSIGCSQMISKIEAFQKKYIDFLEDVPENTYRCVRC